MNLTDPLPIPKLLDQAVKLNNTYKDFKDEVAAVSPDLAQRLDVKPLLTSKSPWITLAVTAVSFVAARYGFDLDPGLVELIAAAGLVVGSYIARLTVKQPATLTGADPAMKEAK